MKIEIIAGRLCLLFLIAFLSRCLPAQSVPPTLILSTLTRPVRAAATIGTPPAIQIQRTEPYIQSFHIHSDIQYRYSRTKVQSTVVNPSTRESHEVAFQVTLPDTAFISKFSMTIKGETWVAMVEKHEEAREAYREAVRAGKSAGLVETRGGNVFIVRNNVEASESIIFTLTYEELLEKRFDIYEEVVHIDSDELKKAENYSVVVTVTDVRNITLLRAIARDEEDDNDEQMDDVEVRLDGNIGLLTWSPGNRSLTDQIPKRIAVQYDIEQDPGAGQVLVRDGHFVHFFSPQASVQPKHIVFVLDVSGSMYGIKMRQLKEAMKSILWDLYGNHKKDLFSILTFQSNVKLWRGLSVRQTHNRPTSFAFPSTQRNINAATLFIDSLKGHGMTNIHDALIAALNVTAAGTAQQPKKADPIIVFLTDGDPTWGITDMGEIQSRVKAANNVQHVPIFCLGFGFGVEFPFLRKLSLQNRAMARIIYETSDAALQLQNFYSEISSPALSNVNFTYTSDLYQVTNLTRTQFSRFFKGSEIIVAGKVETDVEELNDPCKSYCVNGKFVPPANLSSSTDWNRTDAQANVFGVAVRGSSVKGVKLLDSADIVLCDNRTTSASDAYDVEDLFGPGEGDSFMERFWAYLTIKQLLEQAEADDVAPTEGDTTDDENPAQRALDLALHYEFVTPLTSLLVIRPDYTTAEASLPSKGYGKLLKGLKDKSAVAGARSMDSTAINAPGRCEVKRTPAIDTKGADWVGNSTLFGPTKTDNATTVALRPRHHPLDFTIDDLNWLSADEDEFEMQNGTEIFRVARDGQADETPVVGAACRSGNGTCVHLKDCVLLEFIHEFEVYLDDYFCEISASASNPYAGVCCPEIRKASPGTTIAPQPASLEEPSSELDDYYS